MIWFWATIHVILYMEAIPDTFMDGNKTKRATGVLFLKYSQKKLMEVKNHFYSILEYMADLCPLNAF